MSKLRNDIRRCRSDQTQVRLLSQRHMLDLKLKIAIKGIDRTFISRQRFKCNRIDKIHGVLRHDHMNIAAKLDKTAGHIGCLVCRNAAADSEKYRFSLHHSLICLPFACPDKPERFCLLV